MADKKDKDTNQEKKAPDQRKDELSADDLDKISGGAPKFDKVDSKVKKQGIGG